MNKPLLIINGNGADLSNSKALKGKAKRKLITQSLVKKMVDVCKENGDDEMQKSLWNTFHCQNKINSANGKIYSKYCKNRFCTLCSSIRKADIINKYLPVLKTWEQPYFVTITARSVPLKKLKARMRNMNRGFRLINSKYRKRNQRGTGIKLVGIKSLECNFNPTKKTYNPHLHLIVANKEMAEIIVKEWLLLCTNKTGYKWAEKWVQDIRPVFNNEKVLIEVVKYSSKIFTDAAENKIDKEKNIVPKNIYVKAYLNIIKAMQGLRIFDRFGFNLPKESKPEKIDARVVKEYDEWVFDAKQYDWRNVENDNVLTNYKPPPQLLELLTNRMEVTVE